MKRLIRSAFLAGSTLLLAGIPPAVAQQGAKISNNVVRIGVITDLSGAFSDQSGRGSIAAAQMAVEDFGGTVLG